MTKNQGPLKILSEAEYRELRNDDAGICKYCGEYSYCVEPDASGYQCDSCEKHGVEGIENAMVMGLVEIK
jgi:hypothetical protein